jgi:hypothetical protein
MAARRWGILVRDNAGHPQNGLDVDLNQGGGGPKVYDLIESGSIMGYYYQDIEEGCYDLAIGLVVQSDWSGGSGRWIGGQDIKDHMDGHGDPAHGYQIITGDIYAEAVTPGKMQQLIQAGMVTVLLGASSGTGNFPTAFAGTPFAVATCVTLPGGNWSKIRITTTTTQIKVWLYDTAGNPQAATVNVYFNYMAIGYHP